MDEASKRKNILDLQFQKNLIIASTSIIISFSYLLAIVIAVVTKQVNLYDYYTMGSIFVLSTGVLGICFIFFFRSVDHIREIPKIIGSI